MVKVNIVQLTDTHIVDEGELACSIIDTAEALARAISHINSILPMIDSVDAVVVTGDITDNGTLAAYDLFKRITAPLGCPIYLLPGNHDFREPMRHSFADHDYISETGPLNFHEVVGSVNLLGLDDLVEGQASGELSVETLDWLSGKLAQLEGKPTIIALHHHPFESGIPHMDSQSLANQKVFIKIVANHKGAHIVICGHVHRYITRHTQAGPIIIAPAPAHAVTLDRRPNSSATFTLEPGGFLLHSYDEITNQFSSEFIPVGRFDGPYPFSGEIHSNES